MAVTNLNSLIAAMAGTGETVPINKPSMSNTVAGQMWSLWQSAGFPGAGATPTVAAICNKDLVGALPILNPPEGKINYMSRLDFWCAVVGNPQIHDRLAHMGSLVANITTPQTVDLDVTGTASNLVARRGAADYSDVRWWVEGYTNLGATARNLTVTYTNGAGTSGRTVVIPSAAIGATYRTGRMVEIVGIDREPIRSIQSVQWDLSTGTAGNFGITATRVITTGLVLSTLNTSLLVGARLLGLPVVPNDACLLIMVAVSTTSTGLILGHTRIIEG